MHRTALAAAVAATLALLSACQSGGAPAGPAPEPAAAPAETEAAPQDTAEPDPAPAASEGATETDAPAAGTPDVGTAERPSVILEDGRDLMSLEGLPARDAVPHADVPTEDLTTADAIYSLEQAARGAELVKTTCAECHDPEDWRERGFLGRWAGESTYQLWYYINDRMPYRNPWSLTRQQVTDALAYILYVNELPHGDEEMGTTEDDIDDFWIVWDATAN